MIFISNLYWLVLSAVSRFFLVRTVTPAGDYLLLLLLLVAPAALGRPLPPVPALAPILKAADDPPGLSLNFPKEPSQMTFLHRDKICSTINNEPQFPHRSLNSQTFSTSQALAGDHRSSPQTKLLTLDPLLPLVAAIILPLVFAQAEVRRPTFGNDSFRTTFPIKPFSTSREFRRDWCGGEDYAQAHPRPFRSPLPRVWKVWPHRFVVLSLKGLGFGSW